MSFSRRTDWDRSPNALARLWEAGRRDGILDLTESNPTRAGLATDPAQLAEALADPGNVSYEPDPFGLPGARETLGAWLLARGVAADPRRLLLTASTSESYSFLFHLACDPGDAVLVPSPGYPLFDFLARLADVETHPYRLALSDGGFRLDVDALASSLPERCRAVVIVSPGNPSGSILAPEEARQLAVLARERGLLLVADEVFAEFAWDGRRRSALLPACEREGALGVVLSGLSKACGLPQLKLGWMQLGGPESAVAEALARLELVADTFLSVSTPVQRGLGRLLAMGDAFRARLLPRLGRNLAALREAAPAFGASVLPAEGGWSAVLALPTGMAEDDVVERALRDEGVRVQPGWLFDLPLPGLVISLLPEEESFRRGIAGLGRACRSLARPRS